MEKDVAPVRMAHTSKTVVLLKINTFPIINVLFFPNILLLVRVTFNNSVRVSYIKK